MAEAMQPPAVKLICGMISSRADLFDFARDRLTDHFGPTDLISEVMDFDLTHYYDEQMGTPLVRRFVSFEELVSPGILPDVKHFTNELERALASEIDPEAPQRPINLDPGYVETSKLVLVSMKNFAHRIYLRDGVYAEVTLLGHGDHWEVLPWTFPDYASNRYHPFLSAVRHRLREQLREESRT